MLALSLRLVLSPLDSEGLVYGGRGGAGLVAGPMKVRDEESTAKRQKTHASKTEACGTLYAPRN
jgi:hypothetical protein